MPEEFSDDAQRKICISWNELQRSWSSFVLVAVEEDFIDDQFLSATMDGLAWTLGMTGSRLADLTGAQVVVTDAEESGRNDARQRYESELN